MAKKTAKKVAKKINKPVAVKKKAVAKGKSAAKKVSAKKTKAVAPKKKTATKAKPVAIKNKKKPTAKVVAKKVSKSIVTSKKPQQVAPKVAAAEPKKKIEKVAPIAAKPAKKITTSLKKPVKLIKAPITQNPNTVKNIIKKNEPKGKYELEFVIKSSPNVLFEFVSTASGLQEWFADNVTLKNEVQTFHWDGSTQDAIVIDYAQDEYIRYQWLDKEDGSYFEFKIQIDEITNDVSLIVTDFADNEAERKSATLLWDSQIHKLMKVIGSGA